MLKESKMTIKGFIEACGNWFDNAGFKKQCDRIEQAKIFIEQLKLMREISTSADACKWKITEDKRLIVSYQFKTSKGNFTIPDFDIAPGLYQNKVKDYLTLENYE